MDYCFLVPINAIICAICGLYSIYCGLEFIILWGFKKESIVGDRFQFLVANWAVTIYWKMTEYGNIRAARFLQFQILTASRFPAFYSELKRREAGPGSALTGTAKISRTRAKIGRRGGQHKKTAPKSGGGLGKVIL